MSVFNTDLYVEEAISSVLNQTYKDIELIVINDHSNKACVELLQTLAAKDSRIKLFDLKHTSGVGAARNLGLEHATGDYVYFIDSDDYLPDRTLQILVENIKHHDMIHGKMKTTNFSSGMAIVLDGLFKIKMYTDDKYQLIKNKSVLNILFRKDFVKENNLSFSETADIFSDLTFIVPAFYHSDQIPYVKEAIYFKRKRNDPVSNPSLTQMDESLKIKNFLLVYNELKDKFDDESVNKYIDTQLLNFYRKNIVTYFKNGKNIDGFYDDLRAAMKRVDPITISNYGWFLKKEIKSLFKGVKQYKKVNNRHHFLRDVREGLKTRRKLYIFLYRRIFIKTKMQENLVFMESFLGKNYSDSPKYIYEYMLRHNMNYKFVWSFNEKKEIPGNPIQVKRFSLRYFYYLAKAKYWVSNSRLPRYLDKREGNIFLQTWHGTPLKKLVFDINDIHSADPNYKQHFYEQSRRWDYLSSPNEYSSEIFRRAFLFDKEMLEYGYPRNDILYKKNNDESINSLKNKMGIPLDKKVILYAPTWRDDEFYARGKYKFTLQLDLNELQQRLGNEYVVLLRMHYFIANQMDISGFEGFAYDFSTYDDIAELYLVSDMLITDYSSVFFDYANLRRPILFYTYDLEKYRDTLRGFYIDMENEVPGPLIKTTAEIIDAIENIEKVCQDYKEKYDLFYKRFCLWDDGNASERTVKKVFGK